MRRAEALMTLAALAAMSALLLSPRLGLGMAPAIALTAAAVGLVVTLRVLGPFRWQMLPIEALILAVVTLLLVGWRPEGASLIAAAGLSLVAAALTVLLAAGFPLATLPAPAGPHAVGATTVELVRRTGRRRDDVDRRLLVKVWSPAEDAPVQRPETLWSEVRAPGMPPPLRFFLGYLGGVATHTHADAPILAPRTPYPLIVYNHALVSHGSENTLLMEALASAGFIVVSISHADHAAEHAALQKTIPAVERERDKTLYAAWRVASDRAERARLMAQIHANSSGMSELVRRRTEDTSFVLDNIETVLAAISGAPGTAAADVNRIGALGFSLGGAISTRWCMTDPRCRAAVNLDGGAFGAPDEGELGVPYLMIYAEATEGVNDALKARAAAGFEEETLAGARHMDFTDATLLFPLLKRFGVLGPAPGAEIVRRKNERVLAFFEAQLR